MGLLRKVALTIRSYPLCVILLLIVPVRFYFAQTIPPATRLWSAGPLTRLQPVAGIAFGSQGARLSGPHGDPRTASIFSATRSIAFAGDRIVLASLFRMQNVDGGKVPVQLYELLSLDVKNGEVKNSRTIPTFSPLVTFGAHDAHIIVAGCTLLRLTPDLEDDSSFDCQGSVENISPDGTTLGNATRPGFELIDTKTLKATRLVPEAAMDTSFSSKGM